MASIAILGYVQSLCNTVLSRSVLTSHSLAGYSYHRYYKYLVLHKIDHAFEPGDPALDVAGASPGKEAQGAEHWIVRDEQDKIDQIISGNSKGHYYLLIGEKGTGKTSMLLNAMRKINAARVAMFEAHADLEIFRVRLGKALDYEYHEEYVPTKFHFGLISS